MRVTDEQLNYNGADILINKYPNGYMEKIQYWVGKLNAEVMNTKNPDLRVIDRIHRRLDYFIDKQWKLDNPY